MNMADSKESGMGDLTMNITMGIYVDPQFESIYWYCLDLI